jgi:hypothetical protein
LLEGRDREGTAGLKPKRERNDRRDALGSDHAERVGRASAPVVSHDWHAVEAKGVKQVDRVSSKRNATSVS